MKEFLTDKINNLPASATLAMAAKARELKNKGIDIIGANRSGVFLHLMTIFGALMAIVILGERFMFYHFLGAIFIIAGITLSNKLKKNA